MTMKFFLSLIAIYHFSIISTCYGSNLIGDVNYGETRDTVFKKLSNSPLLTSDLDASFISRTGLDGVYTTTRDLAGLKFSLYFGWSKSGNLSEITYRSKPIRASEYDQQVKTSWQYTVNLLSEIYGRASNAGEYPKENLISKGQIQYSHEWKTNKGFIYLGVGKEVTDYSINITFSRVSLVE